MNARLWLFDGQLCVPCDPKLTCSLNSILHLQSVKNEGGILAAQGETFGAEWKHAAGAPKKKEAKGRSLVGAAIPSVRLRLDGDFHSSMLATWTVNAVEVGAEMLVWSLPDQSCYSAHCFCMPLDS